MPAEQPTTQYKSTNHLNTINQTVPAQTVPKEERLQPIGASDPKQYNDQEQAISTEHSNNYKQHGQLSV